VLPKSIMIGKIRGMVFIMTIWIGICRTTILCMMIYMMERLVIPSFATVGISYVDHSGYSYEDIVGSAWWNGHEFTNISYAS